MMQETPFAHSPCNATLQHSLPEDNTRVGTRRKSSTLIPWNQISPTVNCATDDETSVNISPGICPDSGTLRYGGTDKEGEINHDFYDRNTDDNPFFVSAIVEQKKEEVELEEISSIAGSKKGGIATGSTSWGSRLASSLVGRKVNQKYLPHHIHCMSCLVLNRLN